jgi:hypothetical protein
MMSAHTADLLEKLDRVLSQPYIPPATQCGWCYDTLPPNGPSLDFCNSACQARWQRGGALKPMRDGGRGVEFGGLLCPCPACSPDRGTVGDLRRLGEQISEEAHRMREVERQRLRDRLRRLAEQVVAAEVIEVPIQERQVPNRAWWSAMFARWGGPGSERPREWT